MYFQSLIRNGRPSLRSPAAIATIAIIFISGVFVGIFSGFRSHSRSLNALKTHTTGLAAAIDVAQFQQITGARSELDHPQYLALKNRLQAIQGVDGEGKYIYVFRWNAKTNQVVYVADSTQPGSPDESKPGDIYNNFNDPALSKGLRETIRTNSSSLEGPEADEFGTWYSAFAPLGKPVLKDNDVFILGIDRNASEAILYAIAMGALAAMGTWIFIGAPLSLLYYRIYADHQIHELRTMSAEKAELDKERLKEIQEENNRYKFLANIIPVAVIKFDRKGSCNFTNTEWHRITETSADEMVNNDWIRMIHQEDIGIFNKCWDRLLNAQSSVTVEIRLRSKNGSSRWVQCSIARESEDQFVGALLDRTTSKLAELRLEQNQRLDSVELIATNTSQQLRNCLTPVTIAAEALLQGIKTDYCPVTAIKTGIDKTFAVVQQLDSLVAGPTDAKEEISAGNLLDQLDSILRATMPKRIHIVVTSIDAPITFTASTPQVHQAVFNLCTNARDAMPDGGTMRIRAKITEVDDLYADSIRGGALPGTYATISVADSGQGIPSHLKSKIFEPFFTTKEKNGHTGLGLPTVSRIAKAHGGFISFYSEQGRGSEFSLFFPIATSNREVPIESTQLTPPVIDGYLGMLLVVDDEPMILETVSESLGLRGFKVITASDGIDGLCRASEIGDALSAVITDRYMPGMDGIEFVKSLRGICPKVPVILMSGKEDNSDIFERAALDITETVTKPFTIRDLLSSINKVIRTT